MDEGLFWWLVIGAVVYWVTKNKKKREQEEDRNNPFRLHEIYLRPQHFDFSRYEDIYALSIEAYNVLDFVAHCNPERKLGFFIQCAQKDNDLNPFTFQITDYYFLPKAVTWGDGFKVDNDTIEYHTEQARGFVSLDYMRRRLAFQLMDSLGFHAQMEDAYAQTYNTGQSHVYYRYKVTYVPDKNRRY